MIRSARRRFTVSLVLALAAGLMLAVVRAAPPWPHPATRTRRNPIARARPPAGMREATRAAPRRRAGEDQADGNRPSKGGIDRPGHAETGAGRIATEILLHAGRQQPGDVRRSPAAGRRRVARYEDPGRSARRPQPRRARRPASTGRKASAGGGAGQSPAQIQQMAAQRFPERLKSGQLEAVVGPPGPTTKIGDQYKMAQQGDVARRMQLQRKRR